MEEKQRANTHRCHHEQDWGQIKAKVNGACTELVSQHNDIKSIEKDLIFQFKDLRNSNKIDFQKAEEAAKETFVTKDEFDPIKKLVYATALLVVGEIVRRIFL
jgi:hypothetical protein